MIIKVCQFKARPEAGERLAEVFHPGKEGMEKAAAFFMNKSAAPMLPEVQAYLEKLQPSPTKIYVLVNALGAGEYWGSNINGDWFPEASLIHEGPVYGYETFYQAYPYKHHVNKNPENSFGRVVLSCWNDAMKRVELVVEIDRDKAQRFGAQDVCDKLDKNMFPDVSMGCLPKYAKVLHSSGTRRPISEIKEGDTVISHRGVPQRVTSTMVRPHRSTIFHVKVYGHRNELVLTEEHPLWLVKKGQMQCSPSDSSVNRGRKQHVCTPTSHAVKVGCEGCATRPSYTFDWVRADEAEEGDYLALPIPNFDSKLELDVQRARLLGYYLAEGHVCWHADGTPRAVVFSTGLHEEETHAELFRLAEELGMGDQTSWWDAPDRNGKYITINNSYIAELCSNHCGTGSQTKVLSQDILGMSPDMLKHMLGAYANGDGGCYKGSLYFSTASEELSEQLRLALARCGMIASVNRINHKPSELVPKETVEYQVWVGTDTAWLLTTSRHLPAKSRRINNKRFFYECEGVTYLMTPIESIDEVEYDDLVYNFSVEEDESYVAEGLAVHNCKVPYDLCSKCLDWAKYRKAQATFDPNRHRTVGLAVLEFHKKNPIRGLSVTRNDYCVHLKTMLNKILEDGTKIYAINDYPRFFDISFVFIGADKTAKVMAKLACDHTTVPSWAVAEELGYTQPDVDKEFEKVASAAEDNALRETFQDNHPMVTPAGIATGIDRVRAKLREKKASQLKGAEIIKEVVPSQFGRKALPANRPDIPTEVLDELGKGDLSEALSTPTTMGMILKPREFQRITIIRMGNKPLADELDRGGLTFPPVEESDKSIPVGASHFSSVLKRLLLPLMEDRSLLEPVARRRVIRITICGKPEMEEGEDLKDAEETPFLQKISAAYNGYLDQIDNCFEDVESVVDNNSDLWAAVHGSGLVDGFEKTAAGQGGVSPAVLIGAVGGAYGINQWARWQRHRAMMGDREPIGPVVDFMADSPKLLMLGAGLAALEQQKSTIPRRLLSGVIAAVKGGARGVAR